MAILSEASKVLSYGSRAIETYKLIAATAAANTTSDALEVLGADSVSLIVETSTGVSSGVVTLEGAVTGDYAGTWQSLTSVTTSAASRVYASSATLGNAATALPLPYVRARISTVIGGGTVNVYIVVRR